MAIRGEKEKWLVLFAIAEYRGEQTPNIGGLIGSSLQPMVFGEIFRWSVLIGVGGWGCGLN